MMSRDCQNAQIPLAQVLQQTETCLNQLSERIIDLEHRIWGMQASLGTSAPEMAGLQSLDFVKQAVDDLAAMLGRISDTVPPTLVVPEIDVIAPMKLEHLRKLIGTVEVELATITSPKEVELF